MQFNNVLNKYMEKFNISAKDLADHAGIAASTLSRYRSGQRIPNDIDTIGRIAKSIYELANKQGDISLTEEEIIEELMSTVPTPGSEAFAQKFDLILNILKISANRLAEYMNYDPSLISRIRMNKRQLTDLDAFVNQFLMYLLSHKAQREDKLTLATALSWDEELTNTILENNEIYISKLKAWLMDDSDNGQVNVTASANKVDPSSYLTKLDEFNLDDYIEAIHFNDIKVPTLPFQMLTSKSYVGIEEMRKGELDFLKATVLSKSMEAVTMCSDMPMEDMAEDLDFGKKWMFGLAVILKKGLHINIIHNLDRPFNELMLGLESWIPLYMTGLISPYYMPNRQNEVYGHLHYSSGETALVGECISGHHDEARYYLTRKKNEVDHYKRMNSYMLEKALPLMKIYTADNKAELEKQLSNKKKYSKNLMHRNTFPPIYSMSEDLLVEILERNKLTDQEKEEILEYRRKRLEFIKVYLEDNTVTDFYYDYKLEDFENGKVLLDTAVVYLNKEIRYTFEEYKMHLDMYKEFVEAYSNYSLMIPEKRGFKGINFTIAKGKWVLISKGTHPNISFLVMHPVLCDAIENMEMAVVE